MSDLGTVSLQAFIQGVTEFLPISSSAHLLLIWEWFEKPFTPEQLLALDVALHVGTLFAVMAFYWRDMLNLTFGGLDLCRFRLSPRGREALHIVLATLPLIACGFLLKDWITHSLRSPLIIAYATLFFGLVLWLSDLWAERHPQRVMRGARTRPLSWKEALFIGCFQVFALIPGTSRSGVTMSAARFLGTSRVEAARFALLLSVPAILGAGTLLSLDLMKAENLEIGSLVLISTGLAAIFAYASIWAMVRWLEKASFLPFVIYRMVLGLILLYLFF